MNSLDSWDNCSSWAENTENEKPIPNFLKKKRLDDDNGNVLIK